MRVLRPTGEGRAGAISLRARWRPGHARLLGAEGARDSDWYVPFSMADEGNIEPRTYPTGRVKSVVERVKEIITALL